MAFTGETLTDSQLAKKPAEFGGPTRFWRHMPAPRAELRGVNIQDAGAHNRKIILNAIRANGPIGRIELAKLSGLTPPGVFKIAKALLHEGLIVGTRVRDGAMGQPPSLLEINRDAAFTLGLNIDRDHLTLVALDFAGQVRARFRRDGPYPDVDDVRAFFRDCVLSLQDDGRISMSKIAGIGLAAPDALDRPFLQQTDLDLAWSQNDWRACLADLIDAPTFHENDATAAAIGEMLFGAGLEASSFFYLFMSVGLGGGLVVGGQYVRGAHGHSGEIGVWPQLNPFRTSRTDLSRTLEEYVSLSGLKAALKAAGLEKTAIEDLDMAEADVATCVQAWISGCADLLYAPLLSIICALDPGAILVGGQLPAAITERLCFEISKRLSITIGTNWPKMVVRPGKLVTEPAAVGAAVLAFKEIWEPAD